MTVSGGAPPNVNFAGIEFVITGDCKPEFDDGLQINPEANADGSLRELIEVGPWMITGITVEATWDTYNELVDLKNTVGGKDMSMELIDGTIITAATGAKPNNLKYNPGSATCSFDIFGGRSGRNSKGLKAV